MTEFLLEIGTEELPAGFANDARVQIKELSEKWLQENNLSYNTLKTFSTPRRLVTIIDGLTESQPNIEKELKGPAVSASYDSEGNPTKALLGFCKSQNIDPEKLEKREFKGNMFVYGYVKQEGQKTIDLLPAMIQNIFSSLSVTRSMRWGDNSTKFSRPVHWILALFNNNVVKFNLDDISTSNITYGHRFLSNGELEVNSVDSYLKTLEENKVMLDNELRKENIKQQLKNIAESENADVLISESLLNEVNQLVEYPTAIMGSFAEKYLEIPEIVNITVMKSHQRYFPLFSKDGKLKPNFITISNMNLNHHNIRSGNEKVLRARLEDGIFFYYEDLKNKLESNLEELKRVTYFEEIGSIYDKVERIEKISHFIAKNYFSESNLSAEDVTKAARLAKADLVTNMVQEFTELQGDIGYYYSLKAGEKEDIALAIKEQYLPTGNNDSLPSQPLSQIVNFADKIDNLISCFALGKIPTGSKDPFSLRRQCLGIIRTCDKYKISLNLDELLSFGWDTLASQKSIQTNKVESINKIKEFFTQRLRNDLIDKELRYDLVEAVLSSNNSLDNIFTIQEKTKALANWIQDSDVTETITALARVIRICKTDNGDKVSESLFDKEEEKELYVVLNSLNEKLRSYDSENNFSGYLAALTGLVKPVNNFFDNVMVMVDDINVKNNRLALLNSIKKVSDKIANMDKIVLQ